jgi:hypothetical protein
MSDGGTDDIAEYLAETRAEFEARPWWQSRRRADIHRRSYAMYLLAEVSHHVSDGSLSAEGARRIVEKLKVEGETDAVRVGYSVGYKRAGPGEIAWIDVRGVDDPLEAARTARGTESAISLERQGYHEYGITPIFQYVPKAPADRPPQEPVLAPRPF